MKLDQFTGCVLGLATGDALGAPHEGGPVERLAWRIMGRTADGRLRWTDDTQMALDLAESLYVALRHLERSFEEMMRFIIECGGDVDTIGAMAGALWGIVNGAERLPSVDLEAREHLVDVASRMFRRHASSSTAEQAGGA